MRENVVALLSQLLQNNIGNRLTDELATGIATSINHYLLQMEAPEHNPQDEKAEQA